MTFAGANTAKQIILDAAELRGGKHWHTLLSEFAL